MTPDELKGVREFNDDASLTPGEVAILMLLSQVEVGSKSIRISALFTFLYLYYLLELPWVPFGLLPPLVVYWVTHGIFSALHRRRWIKAIQGASNEHDHIEGPIN